MAICGPASPIPCATYMLSNISATSVRSAASNTVTGAHIFISTGSGYFTISCIFNASVAIVSPSLISSDDRLSF